MCPSIFSFTAVIIQAVLLMLQELSFSSNDEENTVARKFVCDIVKNAHAPGGGRRWSEATKQIIAILQLKSATACDFLRLNITLPCARTTQVTIRSAKLPLAVGPTGTRRLMTFAIEQMSSLMQAAKIPAGALVLNYSVDETPVQAQFEYDQASGMVVGACGSATELPHVCTEEAQGLKLPSDVFQSPDGFGELKKFLNGYHMASCECQAAAVVAG